MAVTSWKFAGAGDNDSTVSGLAWGSPGNVTASDDTRSTRTLDAGENTQYLKATSFGFTATDVPTDARIDGVEFGVERSVLAGADVNDHSVKISVGGTIQGDEKADSVTDWPTTDTEVVYGGSTDTFGVSLTQADVTASGFGIGVAAKNNSGGSRQARIDAIRARIYYTRTISVGGSITPTGTLTKVVNKTLAGSITPTGALTKVVNKVLSGSITPTGALNAIRVAILSVGGSITPTGALTKVVNKTLAGSVTPTGALTKVVNKVLSGSITPTGALTSKLKLFTYLTGYYVTTIYNMAVRQTTVYNMAVRRVTVYNMAVRQTTRYLTGLYRTVIRLIADLRK